MATPTNSGSNATPSPDLIFLQIPQATTCKPLQMMGFYSGSDGTVDLFATNVGVPQDADPPSTSSIRRNTFTNERRAIPTGATPQPTTPINERIVTGLSASVDLSYTWQEVNVPQGWYIINASIPSRSYFATSDLFYVFTGSDTSCVLSTTPTSSSTSSTAISTSSSTSVSTSSPSNTAGSAIVGSASSSTKVGTIAGVCIGAFAFVIIILTAWFLLYRKAKRTMASGGGNGNGGHGKPAKWNGLSSVDSRTAVVGGGKKAFPSPHYQTHSSSKATIPVNASQEMLGAEKNSTYSDPFGGPAVAMPVLHQQAAVRTKMGSRTYSASSSTSLGFGNGNEYAAAPARRPSVPDSVTGRRSIDSQNTYPPSPITPNGGGRNSTFTAASMSRSQSISTSHTHQTSALSNFNSNPSSTSHSPSSQGHLLHQSQPSISSLHPLAPPSQTTTQDAITPAAKQTNRQSVGPGGAKKRKPVPVYDPNEDTRSSPFTAGSSSSSPVSSSPLPPSSPSPDHAGHYAMRNQAGQDQSQHDLVHKSSFGPGGIEGKPLHYLIPDMPMPLKD
ncbi:hypothetical protein D9613_008699 [Agrocybe pediades]|uniref:Uncharacterized protein n=1 Tax=Agrocybe pediades TaxID=84607 RepID=A0A8H4QT50_9AGAR|nr:hypothetical protein D9613_008699 [Agrocybe pediades]